MPRFGDILRSIDWQWWAGEFPVRLDWWPSAQHYWYWYPSRLEAALLVAFGASILAVIAAWLLTRLTGPIVLWDD